MSLGFGFKIVDPGFIPHYNLREGALSSVLWSMGAEVQWRFYSCLFMCFCQHSWHLTSTDLGTVKHFSKRHYTDFAGGQDGGQFICFYMTVGACLCTNPVDGVWRHCSASATTPRFVVKCSSSCFIFFITSYLSRRAFISAVASPHTWSKLSCSNASRLLAFIKRQISALFAVSTARQTLHFSIVHGSAICRTKQSRIIDYSPECSTASMMLLLP